MTWRDLCIRRVSRKADVHEGWRIEVGENDGRERQKRIDDCAKVPVSVGYLLAEGHSCDTSESACLLARVIFSLKYFTWDGKILGRIAEEGAGAARRKDGVCL